MFSWVRRSVTLSLSPGTTATKPTTVTAAAAAAGRIQRRSCLSESMAAKPATAPAIHTCLVTVKRSPAAHRAPTAAAA